MSNTLKLINNLPYWFKIKEDLEESNGYKLLDIPGKEFDYMGSLLDYAYKQIHIDTLDINYPYYLYKIILPSFLDVSSIKEVKSSSIVLEKEESLISFLGISNENVYTVDTSLKDIYYIDEDKNILYTRKTYGVDDISKDGKLTIYLTWGEQLVISLKYHNIWNQFDEFGYLLSLRRYYKEDNQSFKNRILDVFKNPPGSTKKGLLNALGREFNLRKEIVWTDGSINITLPSSINIDSITVDGLEYDKELIAFTEAGVVLTGKTTYENIERIVSYIDGLKIHAMTDKEDIDFINELYNIDGSGTEKLIYYKGKIESINPIAWNKFLWDEAYWDSSSMGIGSSGSINNIFDAKISGFN